jgi:hypothetical protein
MRRMLFPMPEAVGSKRRVDEDVTMDVDEQAVTTAAGFGQDDKAAPSVSASASVPKPIVLVNEVESFLVEPTSRLPLHFWRSMIENSESRSSNESHHPPGEPHQPMPLRIQLRRTICYSRQHLMLLL